MSAKAFEVIMLDINSVYQIKLTSWLKLQQGIFVQLDLNLSVFLQLLCLPDKKPTSHHQIHLSQLTLWAIQHQNQIVNIQTNNLNVKVTWRSFSCMIHPASSKSFRSTKKSVFPCLATLRSRRVHNPSASFS